METRLMMWLLLYQSVRILCILRLVMLYQASLSGQSEKSRNLDTVAQLRLEFLATRAVTISERYKKTPDAPNCFSPISGKAAKEDVNGNEPENHSHLRFYLELKGQRRVPAGTELTIRYNSVFEVHFRIHLHLLLFGTKIHSNFFKKCI